MFNSSRVVVILPAIVRMVFYMIVKHVMGWQILINLLSADFGSK
jgi:hypothetical protein